MSWNVVTPLPDPRLDPERIGEWALPYAQALVARTDATAVLISVIELPVDVGVRTPYVDVAAEREQRRQLRAARRAYLEQVGASFAGTPVRHAVRFGHVVVEVLGLVATLDRPILVLASHEQRGMGQLFVGRVAPLLIRDAPCPVLTVRVPAPHLEGTPPLGRILVPLDQSRLAEHAVDTALDVLGPDDVQIHLLHVISRIGTPTALEQARSSADRYLRDQSARLAAYDRRVTTEVGAGDPTAEILRTAVAWGADLVAITPHGTGGFKRLIFGSVAERLLRQAQLPLLIAHPRSSDDINLAGAGAAPK